MEIEPQERVLMQKTLGQILCDREPCAKKQIEKMMVMWPKRTKDSKTRMPQKVTLNEEVCKELKTLIENHKLKDHTEAHKERRITELIFLKIFCDSVNKEK